VFGGETNIPLASFGIRNPGPNNALATQITVPLLGQTEVLPAIARLRLVLDVNENGSLDPGEPTLATDTSPRDRSATFVLNPQVQLPAGDVLRLLVAVDLN
jgi:hypothetical protein